MSEHTPGPWFVGGPISDTTTTVFAGSSSPMVRIAQCKPSSYMGKGECEANARLIATTPDLLSIVARLEWSAVREGPGSGPMFSGRGKPYAACAICGGIKPMVDGPFIESALGHRDECELQATLAKSTFRVATQLKGAKDE